MVIHVTKKKPKFFYLRLTWIHPLEKIQSPAPKPLQLLEGSGTQEGGSLCHVMDGLEVHALPLSHTASTGQTHYKVGNPLSQAPPFQGLRFSPTKCLTCQIYGNTPTRLRKRLLVRMVALLRLRSGERDRSQVQSCKRAGSESCGSCSWAHSRSICQVGGRTQTHSVCLC